MSRQAVGLDTARQACEYVFLALCAALPFVWFRNQLDPIAIPRVLVPLLCLMPVMVVFVLRGGISLVPARVRMPLLWFTLVSGLSFIWSRDHLSALMQFAQWLVWLQVFLAGMLLGRSRSFLRNLLWTLLLSGFGIAVIGMIQTYQAEVPPYIQIFPPSATFINKNVASQYLIGILPPCLFWMIAHKSGRRGWLPPVLAGVMVFYLIMASSRTAWLAALFSMLTFTAYGLWSGPVWETFTRLPRKQTLLRLALCLVVAWTIIPPREHRGVGSRIAMEEEVLSLVRFGDLGADKINTARVRVSMYLNALPMIMEHPIGGIGLDNFHIYYPNYHDRVIDTPTFSIATLPAKLHNDILQVFVELGLVGGSLFCMLLFAVLRSAHEGFSGCKDDRERFMRLGLLAGFFSLLIMSCGSFPLRMPTSAFFFWLFAGILCAGRGSLKTSSRQSLRRGLVSILPNLVLLAVYARALTAGMLLFSGALYMGRGNQTMGYAYTYHAYQYFPASIKAQDQLVTVAVNQGTDPYQALDLLDAFLDRAPYHPNSYYRKALVLNNLHRYNEMLNSLDLAEQYGAVTDGSTFLRAIALIELRRIEEAKQALALVLEINPDHEEARTTLERLP